MSEFINIISHERRLNAALKELSVNELKEIHKKLENVISKREEDELRIEKDREEKRQKIEELKQSMQDAGIGISDILEAEIGGGQIYNVKRKRAPKPPKYQFTDDNGEVKTWTGQGRMPKPLQIALDNGRPLSDFLIR